MNFGATARGTSEPEAHAILDAFLALGGNFIDTADVSNGTRTMARQPFPARTSTHSAI